MFYTLRSTLGWYAKGGNIDKMWFVFSLLAALVFGLRGICYHWTSKLNVNRNLLLCGVFASGAIVNITLAVIFQVSWSTACLIGIQMGLFSFIANASMYKGFATGKASVVAIITALPAVFVVVFAYIFWGEKLHYMQLIAFIILVAGILFVRYSSDITLKNLQGAQWAVLAMIFFACNDLSGKWSTVLQAETYPTLVLMFLTGTICFGSWWLIDLLRDRRKQAAVLASAPHALREVAVSAVNQGALLGVGRTFVIGLAVGLTNTVGMVFILNGFALGKAGLVSAIVALNVVLILAYTKIIVKESLTKTELIGIVFAIAGILMIHLFK